MRKLLEDSQISTLPHPWEALAEGNLQTALSSFAVREMLDYRKHGHGHADVWICGFGVTLWLMGDTEGAARLWSRACEEAAKGKFKYSSTGLFQPGLLLWFASVWLEEDRWQEDANALFDKLLAKRRQVMGADFPALLAKLLRGEIDLPQVQESYRESSALIRGGCDREALFYAGVCAYERGNHQQTRELWEQIVAPAKPTGQLECYLWEHERRKLNRRSSDARGGSVS